MKKPFSILFEDEHIVVVDKSANVLSIPDRYDPTRPNLRFLLKRKYGEIFVAHRLDLETSGVIIFAKTEQSHAHLSDQFQNRTVDKTYQALCLHPQEDSGTITDAIAEHQTQKGLYIADKKGKGSRTDYKVMTSLKRFALVALKIHTGRTHQIRVHMKHIGAPLLVDKKYGLYNEFFLSQIKKLKFNRDKVERPLLQRSALHAYQLTIIHPESGEWMTFEAPLHKDMKAVVYQLEKAGGG